MTDRPITERDRAMAQRCLDCPLCGRARRKQRGFAFWFVRKIEGSVCPYCKAYERVYGRKAHEPLPDKE
ncbi:MAG: hypothetical protein JW889_10600 [Verrucomicrobia bacterium]|nr:hypothetical protein [Verrucomicrobiota bacterium]